MSLTMRSVVVAILTVILISSSDAHARNKKGAHEKKADAAGRPTVLWRDPGDITARNLFYGPRGEEAQPKGKFTFVGEDLNGSNPKFYVEDERGQRWTVKLGQEARPETAATRLLWAVGYFTDVDYYLPELRVENMKKLSRGEEFISADGTVRGARLKLHPSGQKAGGDWGWFDNPFVGTRELNGLRVMMALVNNWDLKESNNKIYDEHGAESRYVVSDLGASFGKTGSAFGRSKGDPADYSESKFIERVTPEFVDFHLHSRPPFFMHADARYYRERTSMEQVVKHISRADARWLGGLLSQLSGDQIGDAFRAAGYGPEEVKSFTQELRQRIAEISNL
jgi:hypothetical protein